MRRGIVIAAVWVAALAGATIAGVASVSTLGGTGGEPLSQHDVENRLARTSPSPDEQASPARSGAPPSASGPAASSPVRRYFPTTGGSLWATCGGGTATLDTMTPRSGYRLDGSSAGPAETAWVRFKVDVEHGHADEYRVTVVCRDGVPQATETPDR
ncbi:hypothetical protein [Rugosimonospora africana]|uniref:Septum formation initiator n=1 Tax=Rugosimonospora africana TaxID=556532 RepID=A0A8J3QJ54_9ACTN|nr:hypothetical protein [Rugosimonospora africana]GIH11913.1 hypothetical protein Raf01_00850 [Rugosimonospora africana]